ncbi:hypothetical protein NDU88_002244 [Pleurodeles waltl]|uniref:Uncharacterized protein n=1 Tax=Pleurodeles waltl TaxID=8319 RepID=A0AAV7T1T8_PLEWA|nr:hypothetical protein NDU88_002244 [Pleurodeles waltl]
MSEFKRSRPGPVNFSSIPPCWRQLGLRGEATTPVIPISQEQLSGAGFLLPFEGPDCCPVTLGLGTGWRPTRSGVWTAQTCKLSPERPVVRDPLQVQRFSSSPPDDPDGADERCGGGRAQVGCCPRESGLQPARTDCGGGNGAISRHPWLQVGVGQQLSEEQRMGGPDEGKASCGRSDGLSRRTRRRCQWRHWMARRA